jgi:hypothetical protein
MSRTGQLFCYKPSYHCTCQAITIFRFNTLDTNPTSKLHYHSDIMETGCFSVPPRGRNILIGSVGQTKSCDWGRNKANDQNELWCNLIKNIQKWNTYICFLISCTLFKRTVQKVQYYKVRSGQLTITYMFGNKIHVFLLGNVINYFSGCQWKVEITNSFSPFLPQFVVSAPSSPGGWLTRPPVS